MTTSVNTSNSGDRSYTGEKIHAVEKVGYAAGDFASCLYFGIFMNFLTIFYTDVMVISAAAVGTMLFATRTWDWINDIIMGMIADRTQTRMGKFRPWLLWVSPVWIIAGILTFTVFDLSPDNRLIYAYVTYTFLTMVYTAINIPYSALLGVMSSNSEERTVLASYRFIGAFAGTTVVSGTLPYLVEFFGQGNAKVGYTASVSVFACISAVAFLFTFVTTKERVKPPVRHRISLKSDLRALAKNGPWVAMIVISILTVMWIAVRSSITVHFFKYAGPQSFSIQLPFIGTVAEEGAEKLAGLFLVANNAAQILGVLLTAYLIRWLGGKKRAFIILNLGSAIWMAAFYFIDTSSFLLVVGHQIVSSILFCAPLMPMFWSMIADAADYGAWKLHQRSTGLLFAAGTFSQKIGWSIGPAIALLLLSNFGYRPNQPQSPETIHGLLLLMSLVPAAIAVMSAVSVFFYKIDAKMEKEMSEAIAQGLNKESAAHVASP